MFLIEESDLVGKVIYLSRGDSGGFPVSLKTVSGEPYEMLEGDVITFSVREAPSKASTCLLRKEFTAPYVEIAPEDTENMEVGKYSADLELRCRDGRTFTFYPRLATKLGGRESNWKNFILFAEVTTHE